jgi:hypothetical protein
VAALDRAQQCGAAVIQREAVLHTLAFAEVLACVDERRVGVEQRRGARDVARPHCAEPLHELAGARRVRGRECGADLLCHRCSVDAQARTRAAHSLLQSRNRSRAERRNLGERQLREVVQHEWKPLRLGQRLEREAERVALAGRDQRRVGGETRWRDAPSRPARGAPSLAGGVAAHDREQPAWERGGFAQLANPLHCGRKRRLRAVGRSVPAARSGVGGAEHRLQEFVDQRRPGRGVAAASSFDQLLELQFHPLDRASSAHSDTHLGCASCKIPA